MNKGQSMLGVIMWAVGVSASIGVPLLIYSATQFSKNNEAHTDIVTDLAVVSTESKQYREDIRAIKDELRSLNDQMQAIAIKLNVRVVERTVATTSASK